MTDQPHRPDGDGLLVKALGCSLYNFDSVEFVECKHVVWNEILERLGAPSPTRDGAEGAGQQPPRPPTIEEAGDSHGGVGFLPDAGKVASPKPAPDAMRARIDAYRQRGGMLFSGFTVADNIEAALSAPVPSPDGAGDARLRSAVLQALEKAAQIVLARKADPAIAFEIRELIPGTLSPSPAVAAEPVAWPPYVELPLTFWYKNHRGEESLRTAFPISIRFGTTEWHPEAQWLLKAFDRDKQAEREFAMRDMLATPPVRGDREKLIRVALKALGYSDLKFPTASFRRDIETIIDAILSLPVPPGAEREQKS